MCAPRRNGRRRQRVQVLATRRRRQQAAPLPLPFPTATATATATAGATAVSQVLRQAGCGDAIATAQPTAQSHRLCVPVARWRHGIVGGSGGRARLATAGGAGSCAVCTVSDACICFRTTSAQTHSQQADPTALGAYTRIRPRKRTHMPVHAHTRLYAPACNPAALAAPARSPAAGASCRAGPCLARLPLPLLASDWQAAARWG